MQQLTRALLAAIDEKNPDALSRLFAQGVDPAVEYDDHGLVDLVAFRAVDTGAVELVRPFVVAGLPVDAQVAGVFVGGSTMLGTAARDGCLPIVEYLISAGADVNHSDPCDPNDPDDPNFGTVLTHALGCAEPLPVVSALLRAGADPNVPRPDGWTPLMLAAHGGDIEVVEALLAAGADVLAVKGTGNRRTHALHIAGVRHHRDIEALLRKHGAVDLIDGASEVAQWRAEHAATALSLVRHEVPNSVDIDACTERLTTTVSDIADWLAAHDAGAAERLSSRRGAADPAAIAELEAAVGEPLPAEFRAYLRLFGGSAGLDVFEYDGMSVSEMISTRRGLTDLLAEGTFDSAEPHQLDPDDKSVRYRWWHPGWVPFARDGGGNLHCIDLAPEADGVRGQVFSWEIQGGPLPVRASSFERFLTAYRNSLLRSREGW
ncbi:SMI1/KNR4 family protein [Embleya sp. NPDC050154]|uniref:SMI1/KNR4 family protein n=1 Tax=Embleya sp. NPDC050154 TaxID=3363988 RepID=UPI003790267D